MAMVQIKKLRADAQLPARGSEYAAGYDLHACLDGDAAVVIPPHHTVMLHTGRSARSSPAAASLTGRACARRTAWV